MTLHPYTNIDPNIIESEKIDGILTAMCNVTEASKMASLGVSFYDKSSGTYLAGDADANNINPESIKRVAIDLGDGKKRYFNSIAHSDGTTSKTGFKATAWEEIDSNGTPIKNSDGKQEIRLNFSGFTDLNARNAASNTFAKGNLNPQAVEAAEFTDNIIKLKGREHISHFIYGAHSMGVSNALVAKVVSDLEEVENKTVLAIEPVGATLQLHKIEEALTDPHSALSQKLESIMQTVPRDYATNPLIQESQKIGDEIKDDAISVRSITFDAGGEPQYSICSRIDIGNGLRNLIASLRNSGVSDHSNNGPIGQYLLQDVSAGIITTTDPEKPRLIVDDPLHELNAIVATAKPGNYFQEKLASNDERFDDHSKTFTR